MSTIRDLADYYVARLASQYRLQTKAPAHVALFAKQMLADALAMEISSCFDLDTASGEQLDILGKYIGAPREIDSPDFRSFFGFVTYSYPAGGQNQNGFTSYTSLGLNTSAVFLRYQTQALAVTQLTDYSYRQLLKLKVFVNSSNNTLSEALALVAQFFPGQLRIEDNQDMSLNYYYGRSFQLPPQVLGSAFLRPMGVQLTVKPIAAWDAFLDGQPVFNSETQGDRILDFGNVSLTVSKTFLVKNVTSTPITINQFTLIDFSGVWTMSTPSPLVPVVLNEGETVSVNLTGFSYVPGLHQAEITLFTSAESGNTPFYYIPVKGVFGVAQPFSNGFSNGFANN